MYFPSRKVQSILITRIDNNRLWQFLTKYYLASFLRYNIFISIIKLKIIIWNLVSGCRERLSSVTLIRIANRFFINQNYMVSHIDRRLSTDSTMYPWTVPLYSCISNIKKLLFIYDALVLFTILKFNSNAWPTYIWIIIFFFL